MKKNSTLLVSVFLFVFSSSHAQSVSSSLPPGTRDSWINDAAAYVSQVEYGFYSTGKQFRATNAANHTRFMIGSRQYTAYAMQADGSKGWETTMQLTSISRGEQRLLFENGGTLTTRDAVLTAPFGFADVQYINNEKGLRQNFIVHDRINGDGPLEIRLYMHSTLAAHLVNNSKLDFSMPHDTAIVFSYEDLHVWDADRHILPAYMSWNEKEQIISLVVDDKDAVYPVTIDPLNKTPEWSTSANGILPGLLTTLNLQVNALYGYTIANLGDINNDGYDDVAVGAPGMADVVSGTGSLLGVGAVFIYYGSATGLPTVPSKVLQPTTAAAGALFGFSIEAGNISADGINDVLIGAPLDTYQTTAAGLLGDVNVAVTAGKVYLFRSEDFPVASNPSPFAQIRLQGNGFFNTGVLGLLDNTSVKALFGYSIGVTADLNGDNREDIVIGCPSYLGTAALSVQSGAAFVYYSNNLSTTTPVKLNTPTPSLLGLVSLPVANLNGLLFGFSVDGVGDYNNDGYPDVVVGAPAGADLSSLGGLFSGQVLGGSAYVYYGNGSGVNSAIGASLQGSPSGLLSNAADLFGYKIRAVRNAAGIRTGNILISATSGSILSNVAGGLRLKAGQVHVFKKKTGVFTSPVLADQALSSPRSSSVLGLLAGQNLAVSMLFGAGLDNARDVNCDGYADIVVGEPLNTNVPIIGANVTGGGVYIFVSKSDGTYQATPSWSMYPEVSALLGVNATSLVGYSVAGGVRTHGFAAHNRVIAGGPANALDFSTGLLNLGNTVGTLFNFAFDNNGIGKAYGFETDLCLITLPAKLTSFTGKVADKAVALNWISEEESGVNHYELERSTDNLRFEPIAVVFAQNAAHNAYAYPDKHPAAGMNYYRLNTIDNDGRHVYSTVIAFRFDTRLPGSMIIAPNPVTNVLHVRLAGLDVGTYYMKIVTANGQVQLNRKIVISQHDQVESIDRLASMPKGFYILNLYNNNGKNVQTATFVTTE